MPIINTYLTFNGNCEEAFNFYKSVFGGEFNYISKFSDIPPGSGYEVPENEKNNIMHVSLPVSAEITLMGSDTSSAAGEFIAGNNFSLSIDCDSKEHADDLFSRLSADGKVLMPMSNTFWNSYFGMFTDKFGINWMVSYELQQDV
jgi:PhnB protein